MTRTTVYTQSQLRPVHAAAAGYARWYGIGGSTVLGFAAWAITAAQGDPVVGLLLGLVLGVVNGLATVCAAYGVVRRAEPKVTPLVSPRDNRGRRLVAEVPAAPPVRSSVFRNSVPPRVETSRGADVEDLRSRRRQVSGRHAEPEGDPRDPFTPAPGVFVPGAVADAGYTPPGYEVPIPDSDADDYGGRPSGGNFRGPVSYHSPTTHDGGGCSPGDSGGDSGGGSCGGGSCGGGE